MFAPSNRPQPGPRHHSTEAVSILSSSAAQSLLAGLTTPHASEFMYRPRPTFSRSTTAPVELPTTHGLGFHLQPPQSQPRVVARPAAPMLPSVGLPFEHPVLPPLRSHPDLFSPASVYSSNSPESNFHTSTSPSTDSLPSPGSPHDVDGDPRGHGEHDARAWSGTPDWEDEDNYDSPVWGSRWARHRNDSTVSDSLWGSLDGGGSSLFSLSTGGLKDVVAVDANRAGRRSSTGSSLVGGHVAAHRTFLPVPRSFSRRNDSSVGSLFRFAGPPASLATRSASSPPIGDGDGWDDLSSAISDEVLGGGSSGHHHSSLPTFGDNSFGSFGSTTRYGSQDTRASYDSAFQFDGPAHSHLHQLRRPSADSLPVPPAATANILRRAPVVNGNLYPAPANAGAELLFRRNSAGSFTDYQNRRASFERRTSIGSHPLVASVDPLVSPEADERTGETFDAPLAVPSGSGKHTQSVNGSARRESSQSELEREHRLAFLMDLDRRVSQVVEVQSGGRQYRADQWEIEPSAIRSIWSPSTVASDTSDRLDLDDLQETDRPSLQSTQGESDASPALSGATASPSDLYSTLHTNISLTFSFEERLSPFSRTMALPIAESPEADDSAGLFQAEDLLPDLSPRPLVSAFSLACSGRPATSYFDLLPRGSKRPTATATSSFSAFADDTDESDAESDPGCNSQVDVVEITTVRRIELQMAAGSRTPPAKGSAVFDNKTPRPLRVRNPDLAADEDDGDDADELGYLAQMVRVLPTPQSSLTAAGRRGSSTRQNQQVADRQPLDDFALALPRSISTAGLVAVAGPLDKPLPRAPHPMRLRAVQSMSSIQPEAPLPSPAASRDKFDRMATFLSTTAERPTSALGSERSISPFTRPPTAQDRRFSRGRRQAGAWDLPWGAQLARSSIGSAAADPSAPEPTGRQTSYVSQARPPTPAGKASNAGSRRPSTAPSLPFEDVFVKQVLEQTDTQVKVHVGMTDSPPDRPPAVPPKPTKQPPLQQRKPVPSLPSLRSNPERRSPVQPQQEQTPEVCLCPLFFERVDGRRLPVAHPLHPPPPLPPNERTRSDPILGPSAMARTTIHDPRRSPVRFSVPRKDAPARPTLPRAVLSESAVSKGSSNSSQPPLPPAPELKKRRSRAVLSRLFAKRDKPVSS